MTNGGDGALARESRGQFALLSPGHLRELCTIEVEKEKEASAALGIFPNLAIIPSGSILLDSGRRNDRRHQEFPAAILKDLQNRVLKLESRTADSNSLGQ